MTWVKFKYCILKKYRSWLIKVFIFTMLFSFLLSAIYVRDLGQHYQQAVVDNYDIYVTVSSLLNDDDYMRMVSVSDTEYYEKLMDYICFGNGISNQNYSYNDMGITNRYISPQEYDENGLKGFIIHNYEIDNRQLQNQWKRYNSDLFHGLSGSYSLVSARNSSFTDIELGKISLAQGRSFSDQELENGEDVCIIPDDLVVVQKELNRPVLKEISVGDHITVSEIMNSTAPDGLLDLKTESRTYLVIGKYEVNRLYKNSFMGITIYIPEKSMLRDLSYKYELSENNEVLFDHWCYSVTPMLYKIDSLDMLDMLIEDIENAKSDDLSYYASTDRIASLISAVQSVTNNITSISAMVYLCGLMLCVLMIFLDMYFKQKEFGLLLSLGEKKKNLFISNLLENNLLIIVAAIITGFLTTALITRYLPSLFNTMFGKGEYSFMETVPFVLSSADYRTILIYLLVIELSLTLTVLITVNRYDPKELLRK